MSIVSGMVVWVAGVAGVRPRRSRVVREGNMANGKEQDGHQNNGRKAVGSGKQNMESPFLDSCRFGGRRRLFGGEPAVLWAGNPVDQVRDSPIVLVSYDVSGIRMLDCFFLSEKTLR